MSPGSDNDNVASRTLAAASPATDRALANWAANADALCSSQPRLIEALAAVEPPVGEWLYGRDGALTALDVEGQWWAGCSVPLLAAREMLRKLDAGGRVGCFLCPTFAAHLRVALDMLGAQQAIVSVSPDVAALSVALHAEDFSDAVRAGRLWFAWGDGWEHELRRVFEANPGLPTPSQFVRLPTTPTEDVERMVASAQQVFAGVSTGRAETASSLRDAWRPRGRGVRRRVCVVAPSRFRLWHDAGAVLFESLNAAAGTAAVDVLPFDPDRPLSGSPLALAAAASDCDAILSADAGRADLPNAIPPAMPWVTWVTTPRVPAATASAPDDALLLADPAWSASARAAGWPRDRIYVAGWPVDASAPAAAAGGFLALVADTRPAEPPEALSEFSSHVLLWERLRAAVTRDPFAVGDDPAAFLAAMMRGAGVEGDRIDPRLFVEGVIVPAYQHALARLLLRERLPVRLFGHGWDAVDAFGPFTAGPVRGRRDLRRIAHECAAFVHAWPGRHVHPVDSLGRPVVRTGGSERSFLQQARRGVAGGPLDTPRGAQVSLVDAILPLFA